MLAKACGEGRDTGIPQAPGDSVGREGGTGSHSVPWGQQEPNPELGIAWHLDGLRGDLPP